MMMVKVARHTKPQQLAINLNLKIMFKMFHNFTDMAEN